MKPYIFHQSVCSHHVHAQFPVPLSHIVHVCLDVEWHWNYRYSITNILNDIYMCLNKHVSSYKFSMCVYFINSINHTFRMMFYYREKSFHKLFISYSKLLSLLCSCDWKIIKIRSYKRAWNFSVCPSLLWRWSGRGEFTAIYCNRVREFICWPIPSNKML